MTQGYWRERGKHKSRTVQNKVLKAILKPEIPKWVDNRTKAIFQKEVDGLDYWESKILTNLEFLVASSKNLQEHLPGYPSCFPIITRPPKAAWTTKVAWLKRKAMRDETVARGRKRW